MPNSLIKKVIQGHQMKDKRLYLFANLNTFSSLVIGTDIFVYDYIRRIMDYCVNNLETKSLL